MLKEQNWRLKTKVTNHEKVRKQEILGIRKRYEAMKDDTETFEPEDEKPKKRIKLKE